MRGLFREAERAARPTDGHPGVAGDDGGHAALSRLQHTTLWIILLCGLSLRIAQIECLRGDLLFDHPIVDESAYVHQARALAHDKPAAERAYWQPPGIVYALSVVFRVAGYGLAWPRYVQALLSSLACLLLFAVARRFLPPTWALAATAVAAFHGVLVFAASELMPHTWAMTLDVAAIWLLLLARERKSVLLTGTAGIALGASIVFVPTLLPFVPLALLWVSAGSGYRRLLSAGALLVGVAAPIAPVAVRNYRAQGQLVLLSTNGGINFYIGNNERYPSTLEIRPGRHWAELVREPSLKGIRQPGAESSYFYAKAFSFIAREPLRAAANALRKLYLFFHGREIPRDSDIYEARRESPLLRLLVSPGPLHLPDGILMPLALTGLALSWSQWRRRWLLMGFVVAQALTISAFFVTSRYRVPSLPLLCLFAVVAAQRLLAIVRQASAGRWVVLLGLAGAVAAANLPLRETTMSFAGELDMYRGLALMRQGRMGDAARSLAVAADQGPRDARLWFDFGNLHWKLGRLEDAVSLWSRAAELDPWDVRPRRRIAFVRAQAGDPEAARRALEANIAAARRPASDYAHEHFTIGKLSKEVGDLSRALDAFRMALAADVDHFRHYGAEYVEGAAGEGGARDARFWLAFGDLVGDSGDLGAAATAWRRAVERAPMDGPLLAEVTRRRARLVARAAGQLGAVKPLSPRTEGVN